VRRDTLIDFFRDLITIRGEFLVYDDGYKRRGHSYEAVGRAARGFAARLTAAGCSKDDKVIFWGENRPEWIACYWGCVICGVIVVPIDYRSSPDFVVKVCGIVDAKIVLVGEDTASRSDSIAATGVISGDSPTSTGTPTVLCLRSPSRATTSRKSSSPPGYRRTEGCRHPSSQRAGEHRPVEREV
jgi:acyl-CoA synthetase (AMP-forming)/AMP-acid ligase II